MSKNIKRSTSILIIIAIFASLALVAYAASLFFGRSGEHVSNLSKKQYFEFELSDCFVEEGELGPGESVTINPIITNTGTEAMYAFIRVEMPLVNSSGLYDLSSGWSLEESGAVNDKWVEVYRYGELGAGGSTSKLADKLTMKNIEKSIYSALGDMNVDMEGFAVGTDDEIEENAWVDIKAYYGIE